LLIGGYRYFFIVISEKQSHVFFAKKMKHNLEPQTKSCYTRKNLMQTWTSLLESLEMYLWSYSISAWASAQAAPSPTTSGVGTVPDLTDKINHSREKEAFPHVQVVCNSNFQNKINQLNYGRRTLSP
jgi:hypothetical protein